MKTTQKSRNILHLRYMVAAALLTAGSAASAGSDPTAVWGVDQASLSRRGHLMEVELTLNLKHMQVPSQEAVLLTPMIVNGSDTMALHSVGVYGRSRYYHYQRRSPAMLSGHDEITIRQSERPDTLQYEAVVPYNEWMDGARLEIAATSYGCCSTPIASDTRHNLAEYCELRMPPVRPAYIKATACGEKTDSLCDRAYISFVVNRTEIDASHADNLRELAGIRHSIDTVLGDSDFTITGIFLKGYASPESPYAHNERLARGRTSALRDYLMQQYSFPSNLIHTDFEAEDWNGLRRYVEASGLPGRNGILAIIDSEADPDAKEARIKREYPDDYAILLSQAYPALRHTDYRVEYTIRRFTDIAEISRIFDSSPRKLSLDELYLLAGAEEPGTHRFNEIYTTAARMYPDDEVANLNAANAALQSGSLSQAETYLRKCGNTPQAQYARGILAVLRGDATEAIPLLQQAAEAGVDGASEMAAYAAKIID